ncbi:MAG: hypothetical protein IJM37_04935 [Lachnospiraceae bacterium]|nr:hypothetical protein [Lachnospiraceae bacterium]
MVKTYFCPSCGAAMTFDAVSQRLACSHCGSNMTVEEAEKLAEHKETSAYEHDNGSGEAKSEEKKDSNEIDCKVYHCPTCGAEILTDRYTTATLCSFCGNPGLMEDRIEGILKPAYVIPFSIDKNNAMDIFRNWSRTGRLTPTSFKSQSNIEKLTGMYVPYWMYDIRVNVDMNAHCTRTTSQTRGDYIYTYTHNYSVNRSATGTYQKVPADASEKLNDDMMDLLEPYDYSKMVDFNESYLLGYQAERYNLNSDQTAERAVRRVSAFAESDVRGSIVGYQTTNILSKNVRADLLLTKYAMLPVWILNYRYYGKDYTTVINGETGKLVGTLPISRAKTLAAFGIFTFAIFAIISIIMMIFS